MSELSNTIAAANDTIGAYAQDQVILLWQVESIAFAIAKPLRRYVRCLMRSQDRIDTSCRGIVVCEGVQASATGVPFFCTGSHFPTNCTALGMALYVV